jgi:hypothetical protein
MANVPLFPSKVMSSITSTVLVRLQVRSGINQVFRMLTHNDIHEMCRTSINGSKEFMLYYDGKTYITATSFRIQGIHIFP